MCKRFVISTISFILIIIFFSPVYAVGEKMPISVRIAVIDTGIKTNRLDGEKIHEGKNYITDGPTQDLDGHGTRIASIILGADNGELKLTGSAPEAYLVPLVYSSKLPSGVPVCGGVDMIAQCVRDAIDIYGCQIICISSGIIYDDEILREAVLYAEEMGVVVVSAVGNDNIRAPERIYYPAAYETVIGVGSVNSDGEVSSFSQQNTGVDLYALGEDVMAVSIKNAKFYENVNGTSYAAAYIAGTVARLFMENPELTPAEVRNMLY